MGMARPVDSGPAIWSADAHKMSGLHGRGDLDAGSGDRSEHGALFCSKWGVVQSTAVSGAGAIGDTSRKQTEFRRRVGLVPELSRLAERQYHLFDDGHFARVLVQSDGSRRSRAGAGAT